MNIFCYRNKEDVTGWMIRNCVVKSFERRRTFKEV
jgi:hypothetical protein